MKNNKKTNYKKEYKRQDNEKQEEPRFDDQVEGRNSVLELLESGKDINKIFITSGEKHGSINKIIAMAKEKRIIIPCTPAVSAVLIIEPKLCGSSIPSNISTNGSSFLCFAVFIISSIWQYSNGGTIAITPW